MYYGLSFKRGIVYSSAKENDVNKYMKEHYGNAYRVIK